MVDSIIQRVNFLEPVEDLLEETNELMRKQSKEQNPDLVEAVEHLLSSGGKRIRPAVALLCGRMLGAPRESLVTLAAAIELLHTATLVHDDLIDGALFRRGNATINSRWTPAATVLTGDFIFARAANLAAETNSVIVMKLFAETLAVIVNGEITQLFNKNGIPSVTNYENRIYAKTASMFELASEAAAVLSSAEISVVDAMGSFGRNIGMAFQIVDDILDFTGETKSIGKPVGSDLLQGIITLPAIMYLENSQDADIFKSILEKRSYEEEEIDLLVKAVRNSKVIDQSFDRAKDYTKTSKDILTAYPDSIYKDALYHMLEFIVDRRT